MVIDTNEMNMRWRYGRHTKRARELHQSAKQTVAYSYLVSRLPAHIALLWVASATSANRLQELKCQRL